MFKESIKDCVSLEGVVPFLLSLLVYRLQEFNCLVVRIELCTVACKYQAGWESWVGLKYYQSYWGKCLYVSWRRTWGRVRSVYVLTCIMATKALDKNSDSPTVSFANLISLNFLRNRIIFLIHAQWSKFLSQERRNANYLKPVKNCMNI